MPAYSNSWVELRRLALRQNIRTLRRASGRGATLVAVVKSNAYGHGLGLVARECERSGQVDWLATAGIEEATELRRLGLKLPLLVLSYYNPTDNILRRISNTHLSLHNEAQAKLLSSRGVRAPLHLKVDTGTSRLGVRWRDVYGTVCRIRARYPRLNLVGLWTHFSDAEDGDWRVTEHQRKLLTAARDACRRAGWLPRYVHSDCSAVALRSRTDDTNLVRAGLALYGLWPSRATEGASGLKLVPAMSWKSTVVAVRDLPAGACIGYGRTYRCPRPSRVATVSVGYWDGYRRAYGGAHVIVRGHRCPIRGRVCMNLTMVDVTGVPNVKAGDSVTLLGQSGKVAVSAEELARLAGTINYEVVTAVNPLLQRRLL